jgi:polyhydroxyalkanoate synthesis regulator phasin
MLKSDYEKKMHPRQRQLAEIPAIRNRNNKILTTIMTQSQEPNEDRRIDRQLRTIARRVNRLEDTQVTWGELNVEFDRLYDEVDELKAEMNQRFTTLETSMNQRFDSLDSKFDLIMRQITGQANS